MNNDFCARLYKSKGNSSILKQSATQAKPQVHKYIWPETFRGSLMILHHILLEFCDKQDMRTGAKLNALH